MNSITFKDTEIEILIEDLVNLNHDAIIIPTNSRLLPSGDLRCNLLKKAGATVQIECNKLINKITMLPVGNSVITSGGNLNSKYIIHAVGPKFGQGHEAEKLILATWNCLKLADKKGLKSIAFPPISRDMFGFNAKFCAKVMLPTIKKYVLEKNNHLKKISICLENLPDYKEFENSLNDLTI